jgi:hypothetical protein
MSYSVILHYDAAGQVVGRVRCQTQHIDDHPMPPWVARQAVEHIAESAPSPPPAIPTIDSGVAKVGVRPHTVARPTFPQVAGG